VAARRGDNTNLRGKPILDSQDLTRILTLLKPGMVLTVPDDWLDTALEGTRAQKANRVAALASEFCCVHKHGIGFQTFERVDYPRCG
jgi:hypothetical protein